MKPSDSNLRTDGDRPSPQSSRSLIPGVRTHGGPVGGGEWDVVAECGNELGEGPSWDTSSGTLLWVDILGRLVQRLDPVTGHWTTWATDQTPGAVVTRAEGGLALCLQDGVWFVDSDGGSARRFVSLESDDPGTRSNDAKTDRRGRLWVGTMGTDAAPSRGSLYRLASDGSILRVLSDVTISNGMAWSPDDSRMYYIDSITRRVDVLEYDADTGDATNRRALVEFPGQGELPDGMTIDTDGCLWVAFFGGWAVRRYTPDGRLDREIRLPVAQITSCAFGGPRLEDLYVTSARVGLSESELQLQPLAGALFVVRPGVGGFAEVPFGGLGDAPTLSR